MTDGFSRNIAISAGIHVVVASMVFFQAFLAPREPLDLRNAIRVDVVDLPKKMQTMPDEPATPQPAPKAAAPEPATPPPPAPEPEKPKVALEKPTPTPKKAPKPDTKSSQSDALNRLKRSNALDRIKQDVSQSQAEKPAPNPTPVKDNVVRGNQVSAGNSLTGLERIEFDRYFNDIKVKVNSNLSIPQWLADSDLRAQVLVLIDERGFITKRVIKKSSNNEVFDAKVLEAVDASSPLPAPPSRLRGVLSTSGITFNFPE